MIMVTNEMHIDVRDLSELRSASLSALGSGEAAVLIISSRVADKSAAFIVFSEDMQLIKGGIYTDIHGKEAHIAMNISESVLDDLKLTCSRHNFTVSYAATDEKTILSVSSQNGIVSIVDGEGNREDFQTTVLQELKDLGLDYSIATGQVAYAKLVTLPKDARLV